MKLSADGLEFSYKSKKTLEDVSFEIERGDIVSVLGPNGVGKTTFLKCLNSILKPQSGVVTLGDKDMSMISKREIAANIGYVPQRSDPARMTVFESVLLGRRPHIDFDATDKDYKITANVLEMMGLSDKSSEFVDEISGGEYQLVQIARAFVQQPKVILLDEPTSNLDPLNQHKIMHIIMHVVEANDMSAVMVVHDLNLSVRHCNKFILMKEGRIFAAGGLEIITPENIKEVYGIDVYVDTLHDIPVIIPKGMD